MCWNLPGHPRPLAPRLSMSLFRNVFFGSDSPKEALNLEFRGPGTWKVKRMFYFSSLKYQSTLIPFDSLKKPVEEGWCYYFILLLRNLGLRKAKPFCQCHRAGDQQCQGLNPGILPLKSVCFFHPTESIPGWGFTTPSLLSPATPLDLCRTQPFIQGL